MSTRKIFPSPGAGSGDAGPGADGAETSARRGRADAAERSISLPEGVQWLRMHPVTPLLEGWKLIAAVIAFLTFQNAGEAYQAYQAISKEGLPFSESQLVWILPAVGAVLVLLGIALFLGWRYKTYAVDRDGVYLRSGVLTKQLRIARLPRIQAVDVVHPLLGRVFGLGQLTVEVAGSGDSRVVLGYLPTAQLEDLRDTILDLAAGVQPEAPRAHSQAPATSPLGSQEPEGAPAGGLLPETSPQAEAESGGRRPPSGFEDAAAAPRALAGRREEHPLYEVDTKVLLGSILRSAIAIGAVVVLSAFIILVAFVVGSKTEGSDVGELIGALIPAAILPVTVIGVAWSRVNRGWGFRAAATPAGIRVRYGLTSDTSSTLPPGRVHAVGLEQGPLWRSKDWWKVEACVAGRETADVSSSGQVQESGSSLLLPVGERDTALRALWLVTPDLGTSDPDALLDAVLSGTDDDGVADLSAPIGSAERGLVRVSPRGRVFSPLAWRREGIVLTDTCVILRTGRLWRSASVVPYERIQSVIVQQGPLARRRGLAKIELCMVSPGQVSTSMSNLELKDVAALERVISERALRRRREERLDRWLARAVAETPS
ncbi:PH domain-containing protein [Actinomyces faecalis]|uniref:PH domain-containing protein n=1 Tax=Actinomyces faecalis TaxID=2722820 RepID=UPI001554F7F5|nr:PH domain-containing protein [Actinomyces faecalis]